MKTVEFIRKALEGSGRAALALIDDMKDAPLTAPTPKGGNHPLWCLGHLTHSEGQIIQHVMLGKTNPVAHWKDLFGMGSEPMYDAKSYPSFDEVRDAYQKVRAETMKVLETLNDDDLDLPSKACPPEFKEFIGTYGQCFLVVIFNTLTHRGQVADARRAAGRPRLRM
jgi:hypothetical protein